VSYLQFPGPTQYR